jgi:hypothetical protein
VRHFQLVIRVEVKVSGKPDASTGPMLSYQANAHAMAYQYLTKHILDQEPTFKDKKVIVMPPKAKWKEI